MNDFSCLRIYLRSLYPKNEIVNSTPNFLLDPFSNTLNLLIFGFGYLMHAWDITLLRARFMILIDLHGYIWSLYIDSCYEYCLLLGVACGFVTHLPSGLGLPGVDKAPIYQRAICSHPLSHYEVGDGAQVGPRPTRDIPSLACSHTYVHNKTTSFWISLKHHCFIT